MTALEKMASRQVVRTGKFVERNTTPAFKMVVTIDPSASSAAWDKLATSTQLIEFAEYPQRMHDGFVIALKRLGLNVSKS